MWEIDLRDKLPTHPQGTCQGGEFPKPSCPYHGRSDLSSALVHGRGIPCRYLEMKGVEELGLIDLLEASSGVLQVATEVFTSGDDLLSS